LRAAQSLLASGPAGSQGTTVLAYHLVGAGSGGPVDLDAAVFRRHLDELVEFATVVPLHDLLADGAPVDHRLRVALTFDDAYANFFEQAWPLLEERGLPATLFVPVGFVEGTHPPPIDGTAHLPPARWEDLAAGAAGGLLTLVVLPFWTSFLLRVYAWQGFLRSNGVINNFLLWTGIIDTPLVMLQTNFAVYLGIVYTYLPFMILPLYANLVKLDESLLEASADLGGRPIATFFHVTLPLSMPGIIAGFMLVFVPAIGEFVIPELLGGPDTLMIGKVLWNEFFSNRDWPVASAVAIAMLVALVIPIMILRNNQARTEEG
jgi:ABC-type molybdate transport system permease subunit